MNPASPSVKFCAALIALLPISAIADTLVVDPMNGPFHTIQPAIDAAQPGDTILVMPATYNEAINLPERAVTLRSHSGPLETTIDAAGLNSAVVTCTSGATLETKVIGFTIRGGIGNDGGGMFNLSSSPYVANCIFVDNRASDGAGMENQSNSNPVVVNCLFYDNEADRGTNPDGGAMRNVDSAPIVVNCTFANNHAVNYGGGIVSVRSQTTIINCVFWGNSDNTGNGEFAQLYQYQSTDSVSHSCFQGCDTLCADPDDHNIGSDPLFAGFRDGDFRLSRGSPCIDAGDSTAVPNDLLVDLGGLGRLLDDRRTPETGIPRGLVPVTVDIGAYEYYLLGDINGDGYVNFEDINPFIRLLTGR